MYIPTTQITGASGLSSSAFVSALLADSPLALWQMQDASGNPQDSSGNANHCTSTTITTAINYHVTGPFGTDFAIQFINASAQRSSVISSVTDNFTIAHFLKIDTYPSGSNIGLHVGNEASSGWGSRLKSSQTFCGLAGGIAEETAQVLSPTTWAFVVVVRRAGTWEYYINGDVVRSNAGTDAPATPSGTSQICQSGGGTVTASFAYVAAYATAISAARITAWWTASGISL